MIRHLLRKGSIMTLLATRTMTAEQFFDWTHRSENRDRHFELEHGEIVEMSRPEERHGVTCSNANFILALYTRQRKKGYVCGNDTGLIMERDPDTVRGPDIMLYDQNRRFEELNLKYNSGTPKLAVEVLSPNDKWGKITRRITQFMKAGIPLVWLIDPEGRSVTVYQPNQLPQVFEENEELMGFDVLPDFRCRVAEFFSLPGEEAAPEENKPEGQK